MYFCAAAACKADVEKFCKGDLFPEDGAVLTCLREVKDNLSSACQEEVFRTQVIEATRTSSPLSYSGKLYSGLLSLGFSPLDPEVASTVYFVSCSCIVNCLAALTWNRVFFFLQLEAADDFVADAMLHELCEPDAKSICPDVPPGEGRVQTCLVRRR